MDVRCDKCQARYRIDDARVGPTGLNMRCGKCGNTFRVTKAQAPVAKSAPPPAAKPAAEGAGATMMFVSPVAKVAPKAAVQDDAGATMMFASAAPVLAKAAAKAPHKAAPKSPAPPAPRPPPAAEAAGATMMFVVNKPAPASAPLPTPPAQVPSAEAAAPELAAPPPPAEESIATRLSESKVPPADAPGEPEAPAPAPVQEEEPPKAVASPSEPQIARPGESVGDDNIDASALTGESPEGVDEEPVQKKAGPPKAVVLGVAAGVGVLVLLLGGVVAVKKLGAKPPSDEALKAVETARALYEKDSIALFGSALQSAQAALTLAPNSTFGAAHATVVDLNVAWAEALTDLGQLEVEAAQKAAGDVAAAELKSEAAQKAAKDKLKAALDAASAGRLRDPKSPDLAVALAGYYRAAKSPGSNLAKQLKYALSLKADEGKLALVDALKLLAEDDGADKALPKLKALALQSPGSARLHYALARALFLMKNEDEAKKTLAETLKLSPTHERAKAMLAMLGGGVPAPAADEQPAGAPKPDGKPEAKPAAKPEAKPSAPAGEAE